MNEKKTYMQISIGKRPTLLQYIARQVSLFAFTTGPLFAAAHFFGSGLNMVTFVTGVWAVFGMLVAAYGQHRRGKQNGDIADFETTDEAAAWVAKWGKK